MKFILHKFSDWGFKYISLLKVTLCSSSQAGLSHIIAVLHMIFFHMYCHGISAYKPEKNNNINRIYTSPSSNEHFTPN